MNKNKSWIIISLFSWHLVSKNAGMLRNVIAYPFDNRELIKVCWTSKFTKIGNHKLINVRSLCSGTREHSRRRFSHWIVEDCDFQCALGVSVIPVGYLVGGHRSFGVGLASDPGNPGRKEKQIPRLESGSEIGKGRLASAFDLEELETGEIAKCHPRVQDK